ncbi:MAG: transmembrane protein 268 [Alistipes shahii]|uniref:transmembrane protein 268 n=1 Tax=Alistipes shahii TaxID=328814 RepID=UPI00210AEB72|nr:transmembrane protein 268 [Alistipes shahii]MCQ5072704.1 transmembrane protein 268 [Alistipes shahii]
MRAIDRFQAVMAVVFFIGTLVSAWRVAVADGGDIWYVPVIMALASAAMTVGVLQHRKRKVTQNKD